MKEAIAFRIEGALTHMLPTPATVTQWDRKNSRPKSITVCIPARNASGTIEDTLESTVSLGDDVAIVVVDDGSTDRTLDVVTRWARNRGKNLSALKVMAFEQNWGIAAARNAAIESANTDFYIALDSDNTLNPSAVAPTLQLAIESGADIVHGPLRRFGEDRGLMGTSPWSLEKLVTGNYIDALALIRKDLWRRIGGYSQLNIQGIEDYDFWLKAAQVGAVVQYGTRLLGNYRVRKDSIIHSRPESIISLSREELWFRHPELFGSY
jgi:glycosyltransferase involved in cell wall biosynthesis